jgi:UDP-N-acetylmuramate--alanine ligase
MLFSKFGLKRAKELASGNDSEDAGKHLTYSLQNESADVYAENIRMMNGSYEFDVVMCTRITLEKEYKIENVLLHMGGMHNVENMVAAIAVASSLGIDDKKIREAVKDFKGVKRRFEYVIKTKDLVFVDDYAHHPEELRALINGAKSLFNHRKCTVIFQPHLYTRTRDFADGFAEALDMADEVILLPIYPAREKPIEGVSSEMILDKMKNEHKTVLTKVQLMNWVKNDFSKTVNKDFGEVLITAGAGDIDTLIEPIKKELKELN